MKINEIKGLPGGVYGSRHAVYLPEGVNIANLIEITRDGDKFRLFVDKEDHTVYNCELYYEAYQAQNAVPTGEPFSLDKIVNSLLKNPNRIVVWYGLTLDELTRDELTACAIQGWKKAGKI